MKTFSQLIWSLGLICSLLLLAGCKSTDPAKNTAVAPNFNRGDVKKMVLIVHLSGRPKGLEPIVETTFLNCLLAKGYNLTTPRALEQAGKKTVRTRDEASDASAAVSVGKQANASHIVIVKMPLLERTLKNDRRNRTKSYAYNVFITAEVIEVQTERVIMVAQGKTSAFDGMITINGGDDAAGVVAKVAKRAADQIP
jgi:hypothetical protein